MRTFLGVLGIALSLVSCRSAYYGTMEAFGVHKREILVDRVGEARDEQLEAKERFQSALERFRALTGFRGGDLEELYERLESDYEACESQAASVGSHIDDVEDVADALFDEWRDEFDEYSDPGLREASATKLRETRTRARDLVGVMREAERAMRPVLAAFRDRVLFLKHNLNAQAIASLQDHALELETDIERLVGQMEAAIREANAFIEAMPGA